MKKTVNGKKIALGVMSVVAIGGSLAGGFVAGTKSTENKYSYTQAESENYQKLEESLKKKTQECEDLEKQILEYQQNGNAADKEKINELQTKVSKLQEEIASLQKLRNYEVYKKICETAFTQGLSGFGNQVFAIPHPEGAILYSVSTQNARQFEDISNIQSGVIWKDAVYTNLQKVDGTRQAVKISVSELEITPISDEQFNFEFQGAMLGYEVNGDECLIISGSAPGQWLKISQDGTLVKIDGPSADSYLPMYVGPSPLKNYFIEFSEGSRTITYFKNGEFKKSETLSHETYGESVINGNIVRVDDGDNYTFLNMEIETEQNITVSNRDIITFGKGVVFNDSEQKGGFLNFDTMTLENNFEGYFENLTRGDVCQSGLQYYFAILLKDDGSRDLILFKADGTHEVAKSFGQDNVSDFRCECSEDSYKLYYTKDEGDEEFFEHSFN